MSSKFWLVSENHWKKRLNIHILHNHTYPYPAMLCNLYGTLGPLQSLQLPIRWPRARFPRASLSNFWGSMDLSNSSPNNRHPKPWWDQDSCLKGSKCGLSISNNICLPRIILLFWRLELKPSVSRFSLYFGQWTQRFGAALTRNTSPISI